MIGTFQYFDPIKGTLGHSPFSASAQNTVWRARALVRNRSLGDLEAILRDAEALLEMYFDEERHEAIKMLQMDGRCDLIDYDEDGVFQDFLPDAFDHYDIRNRDNMSDLDALEEALGRYFDSETVGVEGVKEFEYFGCFALIQFENFIRHRDYHYHFKGGSIETRARRILTDQDRVRLATILFDALDSVSRGEVLKVWAEVASRYENQIEEIQMKQGKIIQEKIDAIREEVKLDLLNAESLRRSEEATARNDIRHEGNRQLKEKVLSWYAAEYKNFVSASRAAKTFCQRLEKEGVYREQRTLENWLRKYARENGIRLTP